MKFACPTPDCGNLLGLGDRSCPRCGLSFGPFRLLAMFGRAFCRGLTRITALQCPACQQPSPFLARSCIYCGQPMTIGVAVEVTLSPLRRRWHKLLKRARPKTMKRFQWGYLGLSLVLLWWLLGYTEAHHKNDWIGQALISILYLATFGLLAAVLVPKYVWTSFAWRTSRLIKLAVVVNYLTVLLLLQNLIGAWPTRANILAALFAVSWVGAWVLCHFFWPMYVGAANIILAGGHQDFSPSDPQGRTVSSD